MWGPKYTSGAGSKPDLDLDIPSGRSSTSDRVVKLLAEEECESPTSRRGLISRETMKHLIENSTQSHGFTRTTSQPHHSRSMAGEHAFREAKRRQSRMQKLLKSLKDLTASVSHAWENIVDKVHTLVQGQFGHVVALFITILALCGFAGGSYGCAKFAEHMMNYPIEESGTFLMLSMSGFLMLLGVLGLFGAVAGILLGIYVEFLKCIRSRRGRLAERDGQGGEC